jgi:superfamily II DNA or RNA helicase
MDAHFLSELHYYAPPIDGIKSLKFRSTGEADNDELDKLLTDRAIYGKAVDYYEEYGRLPNGGYRLAAGFCADIKAAEKQAAEFRARGFRAECVHGKMPWEKQRALIDGLDSGKIQVLISADLLLYGWDSPKVSYGFLLRRTKSKERYVQIVGRILRISEGKADAIFFDHTKNVDLHTDPAYPGVPPFFLPKPIDWNFHGKGKEKKPSSPPPEVRCCPYDNFRYCDKKIRCPECEKYAPTEGEEQIIDSVPLCERVAITNNIITPAEKREWQDKTIECVGIANTAKDDDEYDNAIKKLCEIAKHLGYNVFWAYWQVTQNKHVVDVRAIHSIAKACGYKQGWCHYRIKELREKINEMEGIAV